MAAGSVLAYDTAPFFLSLLDWSNLNVQQAHPHSLQDTPVEGGPDDQLLQMQCLV